MKHSILFITLAVISLFLFSCNSNRVYNEHSSVGEDMQWRKGDIKTFKLNVADPAIPYNLSLTIRHHAETPLTEVPLVFTLKGPDGKIIKQQQLSMTLRSPDGMKLLGEAAGDLCDLEQPMLSNYIFQAAGDYTVELDPIMIQQGIDYVPTVIHVGVVLDKNVPSK